MSGQADDYSRAILEAAVHVAKTVKAQALFAFVDSLPALEPLREVKSPTRVILLARDPKDHEAAAECTQHILDVPAFNLTRMGQLKMAILMAFSQRMLEPGDTFVFLVGPFGAPCDTLTVMAVGREYEVFQSVDQPKLTEHVRRVVFQRVLTIALELAAEGREGKPVGALFVIGNYRELSKFCHQNIINPFKGYPDSQRNIMDDSIKETVKEFCRFDGAFVIKGNGVIVSAGTTLRPNLAGEPLPQGLGARHATAAAITASAKCIAITLSESTGTVRVWRRGQMITEIEKAPSTAHHGPLPSGE